LQRKVTSPPPTQHRRYYLPEIAAGMHAPALELFLENAQVITFEHRVPV
jgi:hypothetical protein